MPATACVMRRMTSAESSEPVMDWLTATRSRSRAARCTASPYIRACCMAIAARAERGHQRTVLVLRQALVARAHDQHAEQVVVAGQDGHGHHAHDAGLARPVRGQGARVA